ncbi:hypothetical protein HO173_008097 [Letharia columbiana]|uniref:Ankyrin repeat protein n=1 Tax=Letharia columbiana TaxID=112416 RepID=A0A8H6FSI2_9LECA|nr:uncharacterized protein HO173_008097 [Letharia columbiana]KAF6233885.1 hypothetical protein HO173_008097 [Letharia columbiana]
MNVRDDEPGTRDFKGYGLGWYDTKTVLLWHKRLRPCGGDTALLSAVILKRVDIVKLLLGKGCDLDVRNNGGHIAIDTARLFPEDEIVQLLEDQMHCRQHTLYEVGAEH